MEYEVGLLDTELNGVPELPAIDTLIFNGDPYLTSAWLEDPDPLEILESTTVEEEPTLIRCPDDIPKIRKQLGLEEPSQFVHERWNKGQKSVSGPNPSTDCSNIVGTLRNLLSEMKEINQTMFNSQTRNTEPVQTTQNLENTPNDISNSEIQSLINSNEDLQEIRQTIEMMKKNMDKKKRQCFRCNVIDSRFQIPERYYEGVNATTKKELIALLRSEYQKLNKMCVINFKSVTMKRNGVLVAYAYCKSSTCTTYKFVGTKDCGVVVYRASQKQHKPGEMRTWTECSDFNNIADDKGYNVYSSLVTGIQVPPQAAETRPNKPLDYTVKPLALKKPFSAMEKKYYLFGFEGLLKLYCYTPEKLFGFCSLLELEDFLRLQEGCKLSTFLLDVCIAAVIKNSRVRNTIALPCLNTIYRYFLRNLNFLQNKTLIMPFIIKNYFMVAIADFPKRRFYFFDSKSSCDGKFLFLLFLEAIGEGPDSFWTLELPPCQQQVDLSSCGLFVIYYVQRYLACGSYMGLESLKDLVSGLRTLLFKYKDPYVCYRCGGKDNVVLKCKVCVFHCCFNCIRKHHDNIYSKCAICKLQLFYT